MAAKRTSKAASKYDEKKLLERITRRYEQLDERLEELEAKLVELGLEQDEEASRPAKPR